MTTGRKKITEMINIITLNTFIENAGFFPLAIKHGDTVFVFCRIDAGHLGQTGKITVLTSSNGTDWQRRGTITKDAADVRNPSAFVFPDGKILLAAYRYNAYDQNGISSPTKNKSPNNYDTLVYSSADGGNTWTELQADFSRVTDKIGKVSPHGSMLMYDNRLLMPVYNTHEGAFLLGSKDKGLSWEIYSQIAANMLEPFVIKTHDNGLLAVMRTHGKTKWAAASIVSRFTQGKWTELIAVTEPMQHPASLLLLSDGKVLLSCGDRNFENQRIILKLSHDNGRSWGKEWQLGESFSNCDFGYPSTVEIAPGKLLTVFYVNRIEDPYFYFANLDFYTTEYVKGYYYLYSL